MKFKKGILIILYLIGFFAVTTTIYLNIEDFFYDMTHNSPSGEMLIAESISDEIDGNLDQAVPNGHASSPGHGFSISYSSWHEGNGLQNKYYYRFRNEGASGFCFRSDLFRRILHKSHLYLKPGQALYIMFTSYYPPATLEHDGNKVSAVIYEDVFAHRSCLPLGGYISGVTAELIFPQKEE